MPEALGPTIIVILSENSKDFFLKFLKPERLSPFSTSKKYNTAMGLKLSVVIPAYNEEAEIGKCLDSILKQDLAKDEFEVVVVDNASTDKTAEIIKKYPFKYVYEAQKSVVIARQTGTDAAQGEIIVSADADTVYPKNWLSQIKKNFDNNHRLVAVVGWIYYRGTSTFFNLTAALGQQINLFFSKHFAKFPLVFAANFAFKKKALARIGGYPSHLPEFGDQQYLLKRFLRLGRVIVDPGVKCFTSNRQLREPGKNIFVYNGWYRLIGYPVNLFFEKEVVGAKPAVRKVTRSRKSGF